MFFLALQNSTASGSQPNVVCVEGKFYLFLFIVIYTIIFNSKMSGVKKNIHDETASIN